MDSALACCAGVPGSIPATAQLQVLITYFSNLFGVAEKTQDNKKTPTLALKGQKANHGTKS